ncbi:MAG: hypothetical protein CL565_04400 [Alphaproteobacteria bacterium]|nr:hypothetical protein [Alphaproteobacteria bacterium]
MLIKTKRHFMIVFIVGLATFAGWGFYVYDKNKNSASDKDILFMTDPSVAQDDLQNKEIIKAGLNHSEKKVFDNENISGMAKLKKDNTAQVLTTLSKKEGFFEVIPYRDLELYNVNTNEQLNIIFWADGRYIPSALDELNWFMRDWRINTVTPMDPDLYTLMHNIYDEVDGKEPIHVLSALRTPESNEILRKQGYKPATKSQHLEGRAVDMTIPDVPVTEIRDEALEIGVGGVGYYPSNHFVHVDTGRVRRW